jgi:nickel-dependent lactate racemase
MKTIQANHALMVHPKAIGGCIEGNPVRDDLEEGAAMLGTSFILNVILDESRHILDAVAGDAIHAHRIGCSRFLENFRTTVGERADAVVASAGGYPHDINLYQAQKSLENAGYFVRPGGTIILVAECIEGFGNQIFFQWMTEAKSPDEILVRLQKEFCVGGHKAAAIARVLKEKRVYLASSLPEDLVRKSGMIPVKNLKSVLQKVLNKIGPDGRLIVLPAAASTSPILREY